MQPLISMPGISFLAALAGCSSMPMRALPAQERTAESVTFGSLSIVGCKEATSKAEPELDCQYKMQELAKDLEKTELFTIITTEETDSDYLIQLNPYTRRPYYHGIGHNPGIFLISTAIPFWEKFEYGYDFDIRRHGNSDPERINTLTEGTHLIWSASIIINLFPNRGIPGSFHKSEIQYLRTAILNKLTE